MFQFNLRTAMIAAAIAVPMSLTAQQASAVPVGLELTLLVDISGSITTPEFNLQRQGYANAFQSAAVQAAIFANPTGSIAVNFIEWSGASQQSQAVGFTLISNATQANAFAAAILAAGRPFSGSTAPGNALAFAAPILLGNNGFESGRQVIDVSGDGVQNDGINTLTARNSVLAAGVDTINGLVIGGDPAVLTFYQNSIQGGTNAFTTTAANFNDFSTAIQNKLIRELTPVPEPASMALLGAGLAALGFVRRRRA